MSSWGDMGPEVGSVSHSGPWCQSAGRVKDSLALLPRHRERCGPPRLSRAQWSTLPGSPVGRSLSTRPTTGAVWGQTSGPGPARQDKGPTLSEGSWGRISHRLSHSLLGLGCLGSSNGSQGGWDNAFPVPGAQNGTRKWGLTTEKQRGTDTFGAESSPVFTCWIV